MKQFFLFMMDASLALCKQSLNTSKMKADTLSVPHSDFGASIYRLLLDELFMVILGCLSDFF